MLLLLVLVCVRAIGRIDKLKFGAVAIRRDISASNIKTLKLGTNHSNSLHKSNKHLHLFIMSNFDSGFSTEGPLIHFARRMCARVYHSCFLPAAHVSLFAASI